ncbi:DNA repair protein RecO [Sinimarinibacterium thermocellulolyticum]|uniref:DNA repair protein RecO n=1 Tax=Sinimarinibacterium thermocellulolyticum TaxID=3170016 RepID=A0ABV2A8S1_9GAMM
MSRRTIELEPAFVLAQRPYRDSSRLLEMLTLHHGRVGLVARGVRARRSHLGAALQSFTPLLVSWQATGELGTLRAAEARGPAIPLSGERIFYGWYLNELLLRLLQRDDPHPRLYALYETLLPQLAGAADEAEIALRVFEKRLLADLGYALHLPDWLDAGGRYRYDALSGPVEDRVGVAGSSLIALREERFDSAQTLRDARSVLRAALRVHLGDRELATARLLRELRRRQ